MVNEPSSLREACADAAPNSCAPSARHSGSEATPLCFTSAVRMAQLIRDKELSAREALAAHITQIDRVNPKVNAVVTLALEMAVEAAARADEMQARNETLGPLHGLPVAHKDLLETRSIRTTFGSPLFRDYLPAENDLLVERMQRAGAIVIGKTNTPEFGAGSQTFNTLFGATRNPYDLTKTCGGSSGGSAVALACGMAPLATGTDVGGSLRNPAAFCNVVGFRPSIGRVPDPKAPLAWSTLNVSGCMARSAEDLALGLSAIAGPDARDPLALNEQGELFARPLERSFKGVRIAWFGDLGGVPFDARMRTVVDRHRATFAALGCIVEQDEPDFSPAEISFRILRAWVAATRHSALYAQHPNTFKDTLREEIERGLRLTGADLARAEAAHTQLWRRFQEFIARYEYFILPTVQTPPFDLSIPYPAEIEGVRFTNYIDWMKSCWYISATGNPAVSVPAGFTPEGLPVGLQIVGRDKQDFSVLQLAHAFEEVTGYGQTRPAIALGVQPLRSKS